MGNLGFSYVGLFYLFMLFAPNLFWTRAKPEGYSAQGESPFLQAVERIGEAGTTCCALIFRDFYLKPWSAWSLWLAGSVLLMLLYELWWGRYFRSPRRLEDFYGSFLGIPVPGAVLPVVAFLLLGIYGRVVWMVLAAAVLGVGHIGIHFRHRRDILSQRFQK